MEYEIYFKSLGYEDLQGIAESLPDAGIACGEIKRVRMIGRYDSYEFTMTVRAQDEVDRDRIIELAGEMPEDTSYNWNSVY